MEDNPPHPRSKKTRPRRSSSLSSVNTSSSSSSSSSSSRTQGRFLETADEDCSIECSGKSCRACSATMVADCVALCCCPLAVVSLLVLTFIKVPYVMGRKCLGRRKRRIKEKTKAKEDNDNHFGAIERSRDIVFEFGEGEMFEQRKSLCTGLIELDNVLLELYQVGHLGFGRVSFTGIQPI